MTLEAAPESFLRWEYIRTPEPQARGCRHHLQGRIPLLQQDGAPVLLNHLHLSTGYVPFEEVLRFCIMDPGVRPLAEDWAETLQDSYQQFKTEFVA